MDKIEDVSKLHQFTQLKTLIVSENPFIEKFKGDFFNHLVAEFSRLQRLNKTVLTPEVRYNTIRIKKKEYFENLSKTKKETEDKD